MTLNTSRSSDYFLEFQDSGIQYLIAELLHLHVCLHTLSPAMRTNNRSFTPEQRTSVHNAPTSGETDASTPQSLCSSTSTPRLPFLSCVLDNTGVVDRSSSKCYFRSLERYPQLQINPDYPRNPTSLYAMCMCTQYQSPTCSHQWLSLSEPCGVGMNLMTCSYRNTLQGRWAPGMCCPYCNGAAQDPFVNQMMHMQGAMGQQCTIGPPPPYGPGEMPCCETSTCCDCRRCRRREGRSHTHKYSYKERDGADCTVM
jgi:hypothetical protein